ncbi:hypothetical protein [Sphaerotilus microaerophilus]|uniref:Uncharacterized protein n=1 Tax=Sphaerotilus microaerophilus TaxID=2914710 RepID=A0ABN6PPJ9_9BURK|nr:hypothetical protein [Sphaerotilus sp. FB-5]BDI05973.1 hypothetical protein CATMQ487_29430 [Sphaerotilus sp. FB-5]
MNALLRPERTTQNRVIQWLIRSTDQGGLGYDFLGDWSERPGNRCVEAALLRANCHGPGGSPWMMEDTEGVRA